MDVPGPGWAPAWAHPSGCTMSLGERFVSFGVTPSSSEEQLKVCPLWNAVSLRASAEPGTEEEKGIHLETKSIHSLLLRSPVQVPIFLERPLAMAYRGGGWEPCGHLTPPDPVQICAVCWTLCFWPGFLVFTKWGSFDGGREEGLPALLSFSLCPFLSTQLPWPTRPRTINGEWPLSRNVAWPAPAALRPQGVAASGAPGSLYIYIALETKSSLHLPQASSTPAPCPG